MVHGGAGSWRNFRSQIQELSRDFQVFGLDLRGHGNSPWVPGSNIDDFYDDVEEFALTLPGPLSVVAHSFGGYIATRLTVTHPAHISRLALLNTAGHIPQGLSYKLLNLLTPVANLVAHTEGLIAAGTDVCKGLFAGVLQSWNCWDWYPRIRVPTLVILGKLDPLIPLQLGNQMAQAIEGARVEIMPGGHVSMVEYSDRVNGLLREWAQTDIKTLQAS